MADTPDMEPIVAALATQLAIRDPGCVVGSVIVLSQVIGSDGQLGYAFADNAVDPATEMRMLSDRLRVVALRLQPVPEEDD